MRLIIDTDTAGDDCVSLLIALRSPGVTVEAITINCGNVAFDQQVENALYTVQVAGMGGRVPVYPGCDRPLLHPHETAEYIHGRDGMGDSFFPKAAQRPEREHAVDALVRLINANPGELTVIAQAPLTNLAMAARRDPTITRKVKHVWVMGGTNNALGNVTPAAEFNVYVDPEAAKIVFGAGFPLTMVGWEICTRHGVLDAEATAAVEALGTPLSRFFLDINRTVRPYTMNHQGLPGTTHPDAIVAAMAIDPSLMTRSGSYYVDVETRGELTRGATAVDILGEWGRPPNTRVCLEADGARFRQVLLRVLNA
ncbi:MAG: nucleoside hydrolase [Chloroflexota bacterium]